MSITTAAERLIENDEYFGLEDMPILFGESNLTAGADEDFMASFIPTFATPATSLAIPFRLSAFITCFDGIPNDSSGLPESTREFGFLKKSKFPIGAMSALTQDVAFNRNLAHYVYEGHKEAMVKTGKQKCNCCGAHADGLVVHPISTSMTDDILEGAFVIVDWAFPVCQKPMCNHLLRAFAQKVKVASTSNDQTVVMCAECRKVEEPDAPNFKAAECVRCQRRYFYCSKKCQRAHWKVHKKSCKK